MKDATDSSASAISPEVGDQPLIIGVSGMRGTIGGSLGPAVVGRMAGAFAAWVWSRHGQREGTESRPPRVVLGRDSRPSGSFVRDAAVAALTAAGVEVIDLGVVTTPATAIMVRHTEADAGLIATASHNPIEWNGLKFLDERAIAPAPDEVARIRARYDAGDAPLAEVHRLLPPRHDPSAHAVHVKKVLDRIDVLGVSTRAFKVVVDSVNGAGCVTAATLLSKLGCRLVHINDKPDGIFPHEPEPTEKNLRQLCDEVRRQRAAVGFAQDPDADRLAIVDETGRYIGEEYTLALCAMFILRKKPGATVAANLSTSRMIDDIAAAHGGRVVRAPVGEANVVQAMLEHGAVIGGEGNGGVIDPRIVPGRDSLVAMGYVLQLMAETGETVSQLVDEIPRYVIVKEKFPCAREEAEQRVAEMAKRFRGQQGVSVDTSDGLRIDWPDGWVSARASNTEPLLRVIAEAPDDATARARIAEVRGG